MSNEIGNKRNGTAKSKRPTHDKDIISSTFELLVIEFQNLYNKTLSLVRDVILFIYHEYKKRLGLLAVFLWMFMMPLAAFLQVATICFPPLWPYWLWIQIDNAPAQGGRVFMLARRLFLWKLFRDYFPVKLHKEQDLDPSQNYLFVAHPHGILPLGLWCNFSTEANHVSRLFPGLKFYLCTLPSNFKIPFLRELLMSLGCIPVSEESIVYCLTHEKSGSVVIDVVGGSAESLDQKPGTAKLTLKRRTGFLRLAIETGSDLVPVFTFGENNEFEQAQNPHGSWLRYFQELGKTMLGMSPTLFWGAPLRDGQKWGFLPKKGLVVSVIGPPIAVPKLPDGVKTVPEDLINDLRDVYIRKLQELYNRHKDVYDKNRKQDLEIVA